MPFLIESKTHDSVVGLVGASLSVTATAEAQVVLMSAIQRVIHDIERAALLIGYAGRFQHPSKKTRSVLLDLAQRAEGDALKQTLFLAVGACALMTRASEPGSEAQLVEWMGSVNRSNLSEPERIVWLRMVGNSGADALLNQVKPFLSSSRKRVRRQAFHALRWFRSKQAEHIQLKALEVEEDEDLRLGIAEAYQFRPLHNGNIERLIAVARSDTSDVVRLTLAANVWRARSRFSAAEKLVYDLAKADPSKRVRENLEELIELGRGSAD